MEEPVLCLLKEISLKGRANLYVYVKNCFKNGFKGDNARVGKGVFCYADKGGSILYFSVGILGKR